MQVARNRYFRHLDTPWQTGQHGPGSGPSFCSVATAPTTENADKTKDVNRTNFAMVLFTEIFSLKFF